LLSVGREKLPQISRQMPSDVKATHIRVSDL
jgi:hypothetical protein